MGGGLNANAFVNGFMSGYNLVEKSQAKKAEVKQKQIEEENRIEEASRKREDAYIKAIQESNDKIAEQKSKLFSTKNQTEYDAEAEQYNKMISNHSLRFGSVSSPTEKMESAYTDSLPSAYKPLNEITVDGKQFMVDQDISKLYSDNSESLFVNDYGELSSYALGENGQLDKTKSQVVDYHNSWFDNKDAVSRKKDISIAQGKLTKFQKQLKISKNIGDKNSIIDLEQKVQEQYAVLESLGIDPINPSGGKYTKAHVNKAIANEKSGIKEPIGIKKNRIKNVFKDRAINLKNDNHVKLISNDMTRLGKDETRSLYRDIMKTRGQEGKADWNIALLSGSQEATEVYADEMLADVSYAIANPDKLAKTTGMTLPEYIRRTADEFKNNKSIKNKDVMENRYSNDFAPLVYGLDGKSYEYYKPQWDSTSKTFNRKSEDLSGIEVASDEFADFDTAILSFQDHINDRGISLGAVRDLTESDDDLRDSFYNNTFPKIQLAYKVKNPDAPTLTPQAFAIMLKKGYKQTASFDLFGSESGEIDTKSELYSIMDYANQINY
jgi:hypothetical protein